MSWSGQVTTYLCNGMCMVNLHPYVRAALGLLHNGAFSSMCMSTEAMLQHSSQT